MCFSFGSPLDDFDNMFIEPDDNNRQAIYEHSKKKFKTNDKRAIVNPIRKPTPQTCQKNSNIIPKYKIPKLGAIKVSETLPTTFDTITDNLDRNINKDVFVKSQFKVTTSHIEPTSSYGANSQSTCQNAVYNAALEIMHKNNINNSTTIKHAPTPQSYNIYTIFGRPCFKSLNNTCTEGSKCPYSHTARSASAVQNSLLMKPNDFIERAYKSFILRNTGAFVLYFPMFCEVFGIRKQIGQLTLMIQDCELHPNGLISYLKFIYFSLIRCGLSKVEAATTVVRRITTNKIDTYGVLLEIIIDSDVSHFIDKLTIFANTPGFQFKSTDISHLISVATVTQNYQMIQTLLVILQKTPNEILTSIDMAVRSFRFLFSQGNSLQQLDYPS